MKLLFDHNLSPRLVRNLADLYPNSQHVFLSAEEIAAHANKLKMDRARKAMSLESIHLGSYDLSDREKAI
jgi:Domain of unknown function (DUF5615)